MRVEGYGHGLRKPGFRYRIEALLPPQAGDPKRPGLAVDAGLDPPDETIAVKKRQDVITPSPLGGGDIHLPYVIEGEERAQEPALPDERVERGEECHVGIDPSRRRAGRNFAFGGVEKFIVRGRDVSLPVESLDLDGDDGPRRHELRSARGALRGRPGSQPHLARPAARSE